MKERIEMMKEIFKEDTCEKILKYLENDSYNDLQDDLTAFIEFSNLDKDSYNFKEIEFLNINEARECFEFEKDKDFVIIKELVVENKNSEEGEICPGCFLFGEKFMIPVFAIWRSVLGSIYNCIGFIYSKDNILKDISMNEKNIKILKEEDHVMNKNLFLERVCNICD